MSPPGADPNGTAGGPEPSPPTSVIYIGRFALKVGALGGTRLSKPDQALTTVDPELTQALGEADDAIDREQHTLGATVTEAVDRAEQVTDAVGRAATLFETLAKGGTPAPALLRGEIDSLLDVLAMLDRSGRLAEALRLARALERLLALVERWRELGRTLVTASRLGHVHGDEHAVAWARHELGTLQVAAGNHAEADRNLEAARELRRRLGDAEGLAATEHNLQSLCAELRRLLREDEVPPEDGRRLGHRAVATIVAAAVALLLVGGVAGAVISDGDNSDDVAVAREAQCSDGEDNDGDKLIDSPEDPGCASADDEDETDEPEPGPLPACSDGEDNDGDKLIDSPEDPGCASADDEDEADEPEPGPLPACSDGEDNDGDKLIDSPEDPGCASADDEDEADPPPLPACSDGEDNDGDGVIDSSDPGCASADDQDEADDLD